MSFLITLLLLALLGCESPPTPSSQMQLIAARDDGHSLERPLIYRAQIPSHWNRHDPQDSILDTTKPICEFTIQESIRLTIHTFPITPSRIPPQAQVARWKKQFDELNILESSVKPESYAGFSGLYFEGQGSKKGELVKVLGWSMQLASGYERQLTLERTPLDRFKRADYTIKACGPIDLMNKHRSDIIAFAHSFELIDELPPPL